MAAFSRRRVLCGWLVNWLVGTRRYWQGATGRQLKISEDERLQREMEKAAAEEAMLEGGGRARFQLKDDSDSGREDDEDEYASYNDQVRV